MRAIVSSVLNFNPKLLFFRSAWRHTEDALGGYRAMQCDSQILIKERIIYQKSYQDLEVRIFFPVKDSYIFK